MTIKKIKTKKIIPKSEEIVLEIVLYECSDGKKFNSLSDAERHDASLILADVKVETGLYVEQDVWYYIRNEKDIELLKKYYSRADGIDRLRVGRWVSVKYYPDHNDSFLDFEEYIDDYKKLISIIENKTKEFKNEI